MTDEHRYYTCLKYYDYLNYSICHKYEFVKYEGINTQAVESFHKEMKHEIKKGKESEITETKFFKRILYFF